MLSVDASVFWVPESGPNMVARGMRLCGASCYLYNSLYLLYFGTHGQGKWRKWDSEVDLSF